MSRSTFKPDVTTTRRRPSAANDRTALRTRPRAEAVAAREEAAKRLRAARAEFARRHRSP